MRDRHPESGDDVDLCAFCTVEVGSKERNEWDAQSAVTTIRGTLLCTDHAGALAFSGSPTRGLWSELHR